jgi:cytochrome P450
MPLNIELHVGNVCFTWFGPLPRVVIAEPKLVREILSDKSGQFEKFTNKSLGKLIALGLANYDGEKWARHRRILNPAFHLEKLKVKHVQRFRVYLQVGVFLWCAVHTR